METGNPTARSIVEKHLRRIDEIDRKGPSFTDRTQAIRQRLERLAGVSLQGMVM
jgi:hypothetical protein